MAIYDPNSNQHSNIDTETIQPFYYDVHCFIDRKNSYSIPVKIISSNILTDSDIIKYCIENNLFLYEGDDYYVDYITEIDKEEYKDMKGC